jgi:hypothetical protein
MYCGLNLLFRQAHSREIPCIVLYNIKDKDTTNIVSLQVNVGFNT